MLEAGCKSGCDKIRKYKYEYRLYKKWVLSNEDVQEKWVPINIQNDNSLAMGGYTDELTLFSKLLMGFKNSDMLKVEFRVNTESEDMGVSIGASSLYLTFNKLPYGGSCGVTPSAGNASETDFKIFCTGWVDDDGFIAKYEYYGLCLKFFFLIF